MKSFIRQFFLNLVVLWVLAGLFDAIYYSSFKDLAMASGVLLILQKIVLPILELLWMPINLISFGVLKGIPSLVVMSFFLWLEVGYTVNNITISSFTLGSFQIPTIHLGFLMSLLFFIFLFQTIQKAIYWILK